MKNSLRASLISFFVAGLGHFSAGHFGRFLIWFTLPLGVALLIRCLAFFAITFWFGIVLLIFLRGADVVLAWKSGKNPGSLKPRPWHYVLIIVVRLVLLGFITLAMDFLPVQLVNLPTPSMEPNLPVGSSWALVRNRHPDALDATAFWHPTETDTRYLSRVVGMPGDSLSIDSGNIFIQGALRDHTPLNQLYMLSFGDKPISPKGLETLGLTREEVNPTHGGRLMVNITPERAEEIAQVDFVTSVERRTEGYPIEGGYVMPWNWTSHFFGPLWIPKQGGTLTLNPERVAYYSHYILEEDSSIEQVGNTLRKNGRELRAYTFQNDYYFMMGDNRDNSLDSRWYGLVRDEYIIGTVRYRLW